MAITDLKKLTVLVLCLGLATGAAAQDTAPATDAPATEAPAEETLPADALSLGQEVQDPNGPGSMYVKSTHDAWELRCIRPREGETEACQLYQLLKDAEGNSVAEISMFPLPAGQPASAGATIIVPLETLLTAALTLQVDTAPAKVYPFTWCSPVGCVSRVGFTPEEVDGFRKGAKATLSIVPVVAPDQKVNLDLSLAGFTAGYEAVVAANPAE